MSNLNYQPHYDQDFYAWALENASLLRQKKFDQIDIEHIAEEIESMGKNDKRGIISHLRILIAHLLKWQYQPGFRTNSWKSTIRNARYQIRALLDDSPSLKREIHSKLDRGYKDSVNIASDETGMLEAVFPKHCPFSLEQCLDSEFFPD